MTLNSTYQPSTLATPLQFGLLVDPPGRDTTQQVSERLIPGSGAVVIDVIGKPVTKIKGKARFNGYQSLKTFEGAVGTQGALVYSEEPQGVQVLLVSINRQWTNPNLDVHIADIEFWLLPAGTITSGF